MNEWLFIVLIRRKGGKAYFKLKRYERVVVHRFNKRGLCYIKLAGGGGSDNISWNEET